MKKKITTEEFIERLKIIHGDKYDYSKVEYVNSKTKVCIICPIHGEFWITPGSHLQGRGCPQCANLMKSSKKLSNTTEFIKKAQISRKDRGDDYSKVQYINSRTKVCIICPIHGEFWMTPNNYLRGQSCPQCTNRRRQEKLRLSQDTFIKLVKEQYGNTYDLSKLNYINNDTKVCVICKKHGEFWIRPDHFLKNVGCPSCKHSKLEDEIFNLLKKNNIAFEHNIKYKWLDSLQLDFYLPQHKIGIECQGIQHFKINEHFGGEEAFKIRLEYDERKRKLCEENGVKLLYYSNLGIDYPYQVFEDKEELLKEILT